MNKKIETTEVCYKHNDRESLINSFVHNTWWATHQLFPENLQDIWAKHGPDGAGSRFLNGEQAGVEHLLFSDAPGSGRWRLVKDSDFVAIFECDLAGWYCEMVQNAAPLTAIPDDQLCLVESLGSHPTLSTKGQPVPTTKVTLVVEMDPSGDPDIPEEIRKKLGSQPIIASWFPGEATPPSHPKDCQVGQELKASEARARGWNTVVFR